MIRQLDKKIFMRTLKERLPLETKKWGILKENNFLFAAT